MREWLNRQAGIDDVARLKQELKKKHPFDHPSQEAALSILRTSDQIENRLGKLLREFGLTPSQYNVLRILRGEGKPLPSLEIASRTIQVVPAITGLIDRLEKQKLVRRERCEDDRRVVYVALTATATRLLKKIDTPLLSLHQQMLGHVTDKQAAEIVRLMEQVRLGVAESESIEP